LENARNTKVHFKQMKEDFSVSPNKLAQAAKLVTSIRDVPGSNLSRNTGSSE
jgi:hypothetical protein